MKLTQTTGPILGGQKPKGRSQPSSRKEFNFPWSLGKGDFKHSKLKKKKKKKKKERNKRQRNTAQMKEQTRNTEVQINEEEISKLPEKNSE